MVEFLFAFKRAACSSARPNADACRYMHARLPPAVARPAILAAGQRDFSVSQQPSAPAIVGPARRGAGDAPGGACYYLWIRMFTMNRGSRP